MKEKDSKKIEDMYRTLLNIFLLTVYTSDMTERPKSPKDIEEVLEKAYARGREDKKFRHSVIFGVTLLRLMFIFPLKNKEYTLKDIEELNKLMKKEERTDLDAEIEKLKAMKWN